jgi:hypothetical protein
VSIFNRHIFLSIVVDGSFPTTSTEVQWCYRVDKFELGYNGAVPRFEGHYRRTTT